MGNRASKFRWQSFFQCGLDLVDFLQSNDLTYQILFQMCNFFLLPGCADMAAQHAAALPPMVIMEISSNAKNYKDCKKLALLLHIGQEFVRRGKDEEVDPEEIAIDILTDWEKTNTGEAARRLLYDALNKLDAFKEVASQYKELLLCAGQCVKKTQKPFL